MVNKKHKDYPKYVAEVKTLGEEWNSELQKISFKNQSVTRKI